MLTFIQRMIGATLAILIGVTLVGVVALFAKIVWVEVLSR